MVKLLILFKHPPDEAAFEAGYVDNLALMERMPHILRRQANMVLGGPRGQSPYYRALEFYFADKATLDAALLSPQGQEAARDLLHYTQNALEILFVDVFEDASPLE